MKSITRAAGALALTGLLASGALAADNSPLPAGKPAGTKAAALENRGLVWLGVAAIVGVTVAIVASSGNDHVTTPTTGTGA